MELKDIITVLSYIGWPVLNNKSMKENLFTNEKEIKQAIKAAVDQYEIHRRYTLAKHKRSRKNRAKNKRAKLSGNS